MLSWATKKRLRRWSLFPGKSRNIGNTLGISPMLDDSRLPIDKGGNSCGFSLTMKSGRKQHRRLGSAPTETNKAQPASVAHRRKP